MAIGDMTKRVSDADKEAAYASSNPPEFEPGFEGGDGGDDFDVLFDNASPFGDPGGDSGGAGSGADFFGGTELNSGANGNSVFDAFSPTIGGNTGFNNPGGTGGANGQNKNPDNFDKAFDAGADGVVAMGAIAIELVKSLKNRTHDDLANVGTDVALTGLVLIGVALLTWFMGIFSGWAIFQPLKIPAELLMWGGLTFAWGLLTLCSTALLKIRNGGYETGNTLDDIPPVENTFSSDGTDNSFNDWLNDDSDDIDEEIDDALPIESSASVDAFDAFLSKATEKKEENKDPSKILETIGEVPMLNRKYLVDTMTEFFPIVTRDFADTNDVELDSDEGLGIRATLLKAIATACAKEPEDITLKMDRIQNTKFAYIIWFERHRSINKKPKDLEEEIVNYFKEDANDNSVSANIQIEGGTLKLILSKGVKAVITMGDCFQKEEVINYLLDTKNKLPFIQGVDDLGKVYMGDAKDYPSMLVVGMSRSGKSWYVNSFIMGLATFNTPEDVQFLIIDPKKSLLFKTISLLPHCCGLHDNSNILEILNDIMEKEAPRRKQLLEDEKCETMWDLRKKGIKVPYLYIVIDEVMTVIKSLEADGRNKEFLNQMIQIITQLPSLGIGVLMVPHRAQGILDKTTRSQMHFRAAVRASNEVIEETLDVKFSRRLLNPGDIALKTSSSDAVFVRGTGITLSDEENIVLITNIARAFYKMGVEIPDMTTIGAGYNRNAKHIREELSLTNGNKEQFSFDEFYNQ